MKLTLRLLLILLLAVAIAACTPTEDDDADDDTEAPITATQVENGDDMDEGEDMDEADEADESEDMDEGDDMDESGESEEESSAGETVARPAWQTLPLVNAATGETFTLADFEGQTVFVEPMATWCTNCRQQLNNVSAAREQLNGQGVVFVALSVETNLDAQTLATYATENGFDWTFAVMTPEILGALAEEFGRSIGSPPSTPHFVINPDGTFSELRTGIKSTPQIIAEVSGT